MRTLVHRPTWRIHSTLVAACLFLGLCVPEPASAAPRSRQSGSIQADAHPPRRAAARLVIKRSPNLGHNVIVRLFIDGISTASIAYGHTYEHIVPAGRRVVSLLPSPNPRWPIPYDLRLNARPGQTYELTVIDGGSGLLAVRRP